MDDLKSHVAYLKGLASGLGFDDGTREGKLLGKIVEVLDALAEAVTELQGDYDDLAEYTEALDEDLSNLEEDIYGDDDDDEADDDDDDDEPEYADDEELFSVECPDCREMVYIDDDLLDDDDVVEILCPSCERVVFVNEDKDDDEDDDDDDDNEREKSR